MKIYTTQEFISSTSILWGYLKEEDLSKFCTISLCSVTQCVQLFATQWVVAHQASLSFTNSRSLLRLMSIFRGSSQPRDQTLVSLNAGGFFAVWTTRKATRFAVILCKNSIHLARIWMLSLEIQEVMTQITQLGWASGGGWTLAWGYLSPRNESSAGSRPSWPQIQSLSTDSLCDGGGCPQPQREDVPNGGWSKPPGNSGWARLGVQAVVKSPAICWAITLGLAEFYQ